MSKMKELATVLDELVTCGETLISTANSLRDIFSGDADTPDSPATAEAMEPAATKSETSDKAATLPSKNTKKPASAKLASAPAEKTEVEPAPKTYTNPKDKRQTLTGVVFDLAGVKPHQVSLKMIEKAQESLEKARAEKKR